MLDKVLKFERILNEQSIYLVECLLLTHKKVKISPEYTTIILISHHQRKLTIWMPLVLLSAQKDI